MTCPSCGATVPAEARFCPNCGHSLQSPVDERRVVTVLFGDIVGFTTLAESRDPEHVKNLVDRSFARLAADIRDFGGSVDKVVGDAIVALFGAPVAHEDDAERAVRCALRMQRTLADMQADLGADVRMRIGVNTGEVLVGALRAGGDYTAMGDVVNTASRLQTIAEPGTVVVGPDTYAATSEVFRYEPLGALQPRGREGAVEAWVATEAILQPGRRPPRRASTRLVGRDAEAELLERILVRACEHRRPTLVLLLGEAGIGKSRLAEEVVLRVIASHGARVLSGRSVPYGAANSWWPIAEIMRMACGVAPDDGPEEVRVKAVRTVSETVGADAASAEVGRIVEALVYLIGVGSSLVDVESKRAQDEVARGVRTFIEALASTRPLVVTIGDIQWADASVLAGLDDMLERLHRVPLMVVLTGRPEVSTVFHPTAGHHNLVVLNLDPLSSADAEELLISLLGSDPGPKARAELVERSGGNPLFVEELAAVIAERHGDGEVVSSLPATLRGIVAARLDTLPAAERAVLDAAAVVGRRAPMAALLALGGSRGGVTDAVDELVAEDLLVVEDGMCEFRSDLVREVVYGMLTKAERARRHALHAQWLEALEQEWPTDELLGELGRHWTMAAELDAELGGVEGVPPDVGTRAAQALERAGTRAEDRELHAMALRVFERLLQLLGDEPSAERRRALIGRARAAAALRRDAEARTDVDAVEAEARAAGDDVTLVQALTVRGDLLRNAGAFDESLAALDEAVTTARRVGNRRLEGAALRRIGWTKLFAGDLEGAEPVLLEALDAFRESGATRGEAWARQNLAWVAYGRGDGELAEARVRDSLELFRSLGDWGGLTWATGMLAWVRFSQGDVAEAETLAAKALAESHDQGDTWQAGMMLVLQSWIRLWQGGVVDAVAVGREAIQLFEKIGDDWGALQAAAPVFRSLVLAGRLDAARELGTRTVAISAERQPFANFSVLSDVLLAVASILVGNPERALSALAEQPVDPHTHRYGANEIAVGRALALLQLGQVDEARALLEETAAHAVRGSLEHTRAALALALAAAGATDEARAVGAEVAEGDGSYVDRVMAQVAVACAATRDGDGDAARTAIDRAARLVETTQDVLTAAIVARARGRVLDVLDDPFAGGAEADARRRLDAIGITASGWDRLFRLAVGLTPAAEAAPGAG